MKITTTENNEIQIEELFNNVILKTADGEVMSICMRDTGFEFKYQGKWYFAKEGQVMPFPFHNSVTEDCLVEQTPQVDNNTDVSKSNRERQLQKLTDQAQELNLGYDD